MTGWDSIGSDQFGQRINFLPELDPYVMGRLDRETMLDTDLGSYVTDRSGNVTSTIVIDGRISGVWDVTDAPDPTVRAHSSSQAACW